MLVRQGPDGPAGGRGRSLEGDVRAEYDVRCYCAVLCNYAVLSCAQLCLVVFNQCFLVHVVECVV